MTKYQNQTRLLAAIDCIVFGFDGVKLNILLIRRGFEPEQNKWSLMGGFVQPDESADDAASRIVKLLTGLEGIYLEQFHTFSHPTRDPIERTISIAYFSLIDIHQYEQQISDTYHAEWFPLNALPALIFDHQQMVAMARQELRYKAALHPILFELLPDKFTLPLLQSLFEDVYETRFDKGNFSRKIMSSGLVIKQKEKDKEGSKKGAFYFKLDKKRYRKNFHHILRIVPNPNGLL
jgi:ADP-ribose pyrophosphatase YjhB (NUDIX family)